MVQNRETRDVILSPRTRRGGCASPRNEKTRLIAFETGQKILSGVLEVEEEKLYFAFFSFMSLFGIHCRCSLNTEDGRQ
jgi:hypothetical protein